MSEILEILMIVSFGVSWPLNVIKSYRSCTTKGKSLAFLILIFLGYVCGISAKLTAPSFKWYVLLAYILNFLLVGADLLMYYRNYRLDKEKDKFETKGF